MTINLEKLNALVKASPYSYLEFHERMGFLRGAYRYYKGTRKMPLEHLVKLCYFMNIPLSDILDESTMHTLRETLK